MARPIYENSKNRKMQRQVADVIEKRWNVSCKDLSYRDVVDYAMCRKDDIVGWVEIKCRNIYYTTQLEYMISLHKIKEGRSIAKETNLPFFLVVAFQDGVYYYKDEGEEHSLRWGGRFLTKRDAEDQEPCYYIDINYFKKI